MNLSDLINEVSQHGFDPNQYGTDRITRYLNDAQNEIAARVDYYVDEASHLFGTSSGSQVYAVPANLGRMRELFNVDRPGALQAVTLRDIDISAASSGEPRYYALDALTLRLYPTPDAVYNLELRYWRLPAQLVVGTDEPSLPDRWHKLLWFYAVGECYAGEDDAQTAQTWMQRFETTLAHLSADVKYPNTDAPNQVRGMWEQDTSLGVRGWTLGP